MGMSNTENLTTELNSEFRSAVMPVTIFVGAECVLGLIGNLFVLYVFVVHYSRCTYRYFVLFLATIDIVSCCTTIPGEVLTQLNWFDYWYNPLICKVKSFFNIFTVCADTLCLLTIAVDRYRHQCRPSGWQFTPKNANQMGILNCLAAFIMALPCAILWGVEHHQQKYKGVQVNVTICEKDDRYKDTHRPMIYSVSIETIVSLSLFAMLVLYAIVAKHSTKNDNNIREQDRLLAEDRYNQLDPEVRKNTVVMATLTVVFVITTVTYFTLLSLIAANVLEKLDNSGKAVYFFFFRLYFVNHVMNPIVYGILDPEFRTASKKVFQSWCNKMSSDSMNSR